MRLPLKDSQEEPENYLGKAKGMFLELKEQEKEEENKKEDFMIQNIRKNDRTCKDGGNQGTITFDDRMLDDKVYNDINKKRTQALKDNDHQAMSELMIQDDFTYND